MESYIRSNLLKEGYSEHKKRRDLKIVLFGGVLIIGGLVYYVTVMNKNLSLAIPKVEQVNNIQTMPLLGQ